MPVEMRTLLFACTIEERNQAGPGAQGSSSRFEQSSPIFEGHGDPLSVLALFGAGFAIGTAWLLLYGGEVNELIVAAMMPMGLALAFFRARN